jgi:hypothetical protein
MHPIRFVRLTALFFFVLACAATLQAQPGLCALQPFQGVWCAECSGFADLNLVDPRVPPNTMVPFSMLQRVKIDSRGNAVGKGHASLGGLVLPFESRSLFSSKEDCTGEKTYELIVPGIGTLPGVGAVVFLPLQQEFKVILLAPGHAITCTYKRMHM